MKRRSLFSITASATFVLVASACQSAGTPAPSTAAQTAGNMREYVFVGSGSATEGGRVTTYRLNRSNGALTQVDRVVVGGGPLTSYLALHPTKPIIYATAPRSRTVHWLRVDPATGRLTNDSTNFQLASGGAEHITTDMTGSVVVTANFGQGTADVFPIDPATGALRPRTDSLMTGTNPHMAEFSADNRFAYIGSQVGHYINQYSYANGRLTPLNPPTVAVTAPRQFGFHPNGRWAYSVSGPTDNVVLYRVAGNGALTVVDSVKRMPTDYAGSLNSTGGTPNITPDGRFLYVNNRGSNTIAIFSLNPTTGLPTMIGQEPTRGTVPRHADMDPDGEFYIVGNQESQDIAVFRINRETGRLTHLTSTNVGVSPYFIGIRRVAVN